MTIWRSLPRQSALRLQGSSSPYPSNFGPFTVGKDSRIRSPTLSSRPAKLSCSTHNTRRTGWFRGVETLLEMRNCWPIAGLMLLMISIFAEKWEVDLPAEVRGHLDKLSKDQLRVAMAFSGWPPVRLEEEATWASFRHLSLSEG